jgi:hypothetical protein
MSYDSRHYSGLTVTAAPTNAHTMRSWTVQVHVACTAGQGGDEVVQLYTALRTPTVPGTGGAADQRSIPKRELKGFARVGLPVCPGAAVPVGFALTEADLQLVDSDGTLHPIPGVYDVWVGATGPGVQGVHVHSAVPPPLHATLTVQ